MNDITVFIIFKVVEAQDEPKLIEIDPSQSRWELKSSLGGIIKVIRNKLGGIKKNSLNIHENYTYHVHLQK